jgi:hypothetical protein
MGAYFTVLDALGLQIQAKTKAGSDDESPNASENSIIPSDIRLADYPQLKQLNAITALRTAIAEAEKQEPVAWISPSGALYRTRYHAVANAEQSLTPLYLHPPQRTEQEIEQELSNGLAMALHDAVLIRIGKDDEATRQAIARIDKLVAKYEIEAAHGIKENT